MTKKSEEEKKLRRREYYLQHREEILTKAKEIRTNQPYRYPKTIKTDLAFQSLLNDWNEELSRKLEENLPQWLEIGFREQLLLNNEMLLHNGKKK